MRTHTTNQILVDLRDMNEVMNEIRSTDSEQGVHYGIEEMESLVKSLLLHLSELGHEANYLVDECDYALAMKDTEANSLSEIL